MTTELDHWVVGGVRQGLSGEIRYRKFHLASYLRDRADSRRVYWVCFRRRQSAAAEVRELSNGIWEVVLRDPIDLLRYSTSTPVPPVMREHLDRGGSERLLWFSHPSCPSLARYPDWRAVVYDCSDLWSAPWNTRASRLSATAWTSPIRRRWITKAEEAIFACATHVVATVPDLAQQLEARYGRRVDLVIENGVDFERFASVDTPRVQDASRLVYAGGLKPSVDFELLDSLASALPAAEVVLAGPINPNCGRLVERLLRQPNVRHLGMLAEDDVPKLLGGADVGLLPYRDTAWTWAASPLKLFEYLAAGLPVVGIGVPATERHTERNVYFHARSHGDFIAECGRLLREPGRASDKAARRAVAARHDWTSSFSAMVDLALGVPQTSGTRT